MKSGITLVFLVLYSFLSFAQNYECIKPLSVQHYLADSAMPVFSIRIDSVVQIEDTFLYYNYPISRYDGPFWSTFGASWTGKYVIQLPEKMWVFFNGSNDSIFIKANAVLNETWRFCNLPDSSYYLAQIASLGEESILGITDSIKTIEINKYNSSGQLIYSDCNGMLIALSKNYGMQKILNFYSFEYNVQNYYDDVFCYLSYVHEFDIIGMTNPQVGWQNITAREIYGSNSPGDEIHYNYDYNEFFSYNSSFEKSIYHFLTKEQLNSDSVVYEVDVCSYYRSIYSGNVSTNFSHYTVARGFNLNNSILNNLSMEPFCNENIVNSVYKYLNFINNSSIWLYNCNEQTEFINYEGSITTTYKPFLWGFTSVGDGWNSTSSSNIVYSKLSGIESGTPYNCDSLHAMGILNLSSELGISIFPNPTSDFVNVNFVNGSYSDSYIFDLLNIFGESIFAEDLSSQKTQIDISKIPAGVYFYRVLKKDDVVATGKLVKI